MPPQLGPPYTLAIQRVPPHMSPEDFRLFLQWRGPLLDTPHAAFYDVGLGAGRPYPAETPGNLARMWETLTRKRADVVLDLGDAWRLIELRDRSTANAVGRLLMYRQLWTNDPPDARPLTLELVTNWRDEDLETLCALTGITYTVV